MLKVSIISGCSNLGISPSLGRGSTFWVTINWNCSNRRCYKDIQGKCWIFRCWMLGCMKAICKLGTAWVHTEPISITILWIFALIWGNGSDMALSFHSEVQSTLKRKFEGDQTIPRNNISLWYTYILRCVWSNIH